MKREQTFFVIKILLFVVIIVPSFGTIVLAQSIIDSSGYPSLRKEKLSTFERSFKPSFYDNEVYLFRKTDTAKIFGTAIDQITSAPPETLQGFRVQLLSTTNYEEASSLRNALTVTYPQLWIYNVYETPSYKIRAGDFVNRSEAQTLLEKLQREGYRTAWIVPDNVIINQPPKPPLPEPIDSTSVGK